MYGTLPRQLEVREEPVLVVHAPAAVEHEPVVQHVGLERVVDRREASSERLQAVEVGFERLAVVPPVLVGRGLQLRRCRR